jgi:hypothetical protein
MATECSREQDVLDAVTAGRWPRRCDAELRSHVDGCGICQDVAAVFAAIADERDAAEHDVIVPPSNLVWWRSQIRAREEAAAAAARPIAVAQIVAVACLIGAALSLAPFALATMKLAVGSTASVAAWFAPRAAAVINAFTMVTGMAQPILPFAAASILLMPILLYYVLREE